MYLHCMVLQQKPELMCASNVRAWAISDKIPKSDTGGVLPTHVLLGLITCHHMSVRKATVLLINLLRPGVLILLYT